MISEVRFVVAFGYLDLVTHEREYARNVTRNARPPQIREYAELSSLQSLGRIEKCGLMSRKGENIEHVAEGPIGILNLGKIRRHLIILSMSN